MRSRFRSAAAILVLLSLAAPALPQGERVRTPAATPTVTVSATAKGVRFVAHGAVSRMRVEVLGVDGTPLGASAFKPGNVFDWTPDGVGDSAPLADGDYQLVVTVVDAAGRMSLKQCSVALRGGEASLLLGEAEPAGGAQAEGAPHAPAEPAQAAMTFTAHDGEAGQLVNTRGDLSFRGGDFFTGRDRELMRLSRDGSLEVAGSLLARGGIRFADGTVLESARSLAERAGKGAKAGTLATDGEGGAAPSATVGRLAKFSTTAGALEDSNVWESASGNVGVGGAASAFNRLNITSPHGTVPFGFTQSTAAANNPTLAVFSTGDGVVGQYAGTVHNGAVSFVMGATASRNFGVFANNSFLSPQLFIRASDGNVGVGTTFPSSGRLHVAGGAGLPAVFGTSPNRGVWGVSTGSSYGVYGESVNGIGAQGISFHNIGLSGLSTNNFGVFGSSTNGAGVYGQTATANGASSGVFGISTGSAGVGVAGHANVGNGVGVFGSSTSASGFGVYGQTAAQNGTGSGVFGISSGAGGVGVAGHANQSGGTGVYGSSTATGGRGVSGAAGGANGRGVSGEATGGGGPGVFGSSTNATGYGVYARNTGGGMALGVEGNAAQSLNNGGLVKAMIHVNGDPLRTIRCYNSQLPDGGASVHACGFEVTGFGVNDNYEYTIRFPFKVNDRFVSITTERSGTINTGVNYKFFDENTIDVLPFFSGLTTGSRRASFMLIIY